MTNNQSSLRSSSQSQITSLVSTCWIVPFKHSRQTRSVASPFTNSQGADMSRHTMKTGSAEAHGNLNIFFSCAGLCVWQVQNSFLPPLWLLFFSVFFSALQFATCVVFLSVTFDLILYLLNELLVKCKDGRQQSFSFSSYFSTHVSVLYCFFRITDNGFISLFLRTQRWWRCRTLQEAAGRCRARRCAGLCGSWMANRAAERGEQTRSDQDGTDGASQQDIPGLILKGMFEIVGSKNNFWCFF